MAEVEKWNQNRENLGSTALSHFTSRTFVSLRREQLGEKEALEIICAHPWSLCKKESCTWSVVKGETKMIS